MQFNKKMLQQVKSDKYHTDSYPLKFGYVLSIHADSYAHNFPNFLSKICIWFLIIFFITFSAAAKKLRLTTRTKKNFICANDSSSKKGINRFNPKKIINLIFF